MTKEKDMIRLKELGTSCVALCEDMINSAEKTGLEEGYVHLLNRMRALMSRLVAVTDKEVVMEYNAEVASKLLFMEMEELFNDAEKFGVTSKIIPRASAKRLKDEIDSILTGMENVQI